MRSHIVLIACVFSAANLFGTTRPIPLPADDSGQHQQLDVLQIPITGSREIDVLTLSDKSQEELISERNKRTIGLLRELFPELTKTAATDTEIDLSAINKQLEETIRVARQVQEAEAAAQAAAALVQQQQQKQQEQQQQQQQQQGEQGIQQHPIPSNTNDDTIQLSFNNEISSLSGLFKNQNINSNELKFSDLKTPALDDLTLESSEDTADLDDRNKRFLPVGGGNIGSSSSSASAGSAGSGNFLFDIIRLFSGSVQTQTHDQASNSVSGGSNSDGIDSSADRANDGYTEGIPGPITRLVVLGNRGLANLIQDLILRVAATSEKFVNFKAKLITALI